MGRVDEALARSGLTHLLEHLALHGLGPKLYEYDGWSEGATTWFGFKGTPEEVLDYFGHLQRSLAAPRLDRFETEVRVLRAEAGRSGMSPAGLSLLHRFGTVGWGSVDLAEYGLNTITRDDVQAWAGEWFNAGNAVLWMTGPPPDGLLDGLPTGPSHPEPAVVPNPDRRYPAWTPQPERTTGLSFLAPRSIVAVAAATILHGRARHMLRDQAGVSYKLRMGVEPLNADLVHVVISGDGPPPSVVQALHQVGEALASSGPAEQELDYQRALQQRRLRDPASVADQLATLANARLRGWPPHTAADEVRHLDEATPGSVASLMADAMATALYLVPVGASVPASIAELATDPASEPVAGTAHRPRRQGFGWPSFRRRQVGRQRLVVGPAGVSEASGAKRTTVRAEDVTALLTWTNGARMVLGANGSVVRVDPTRWAGVSRSVPLLDQAVPPDKVVPMGLDPGWPA